MQPPLQNRNVVNPQMQGSQNPGVAQVRNNAPIQQVYPQQQIMQVPAQQVRRYDPAMERQMRIRSELNEFHNTIMKYRKGVKGVSFEPQDVKFATQNKDERIFVFMRRHWSENLGWISRNIFYCFLPFFIGMILGLLRIDITFLGFKELIMVLLAYYSLIITNILKDFFDWYFDPYIITNERIIHYEFKPFTKYEVMESRLADIESITERSSGLLAGLWRYGTLIITTQSQRANSVFRFENIPNSTEVRDILTDLVSVAKKYNGNR